jgi:hypothetical protein
MSHAWASWIGGGVVALTVVTTSPRPAHAFDRWSLTDPLEIGLAFVTNLAIHESGHHLIAEGVGASESRLKFFSQENGSFFLGLSTATNLPEESVLPYKLGGEIASSYTFELALQNYRHRPTTYNTALLAFSGTDFFSYTVFAFYLAPEEDPRYDPVGIREATGFSRGTLLLAASAQVATNLYRVWSGSDTLAPSFAYDRRSASLNLTYRF